MASSHSALVRPRYSETTVASALTTGNSSWIDWVGGSRKLIVGGTFDSATVTVFGRSATNTSVEYPIEATVGGGAISFTEAGAAIIEGGSGMQVQIRTTGGGGSQSIDAYLESENKSI